MHTLLWHYPCLWYKSQLSTSMQKRLTIIGVSQPHRPALHMQEEEEPEPKALEELFRKTETKPWLYWLPLTEEQVAEKATRDAAQLPGPPAKPVRQ